jgi:hypothetical protein
MVVADRGMAEAGRLDGMPDVVPDGLLEAVVTRELIADAVFP